MRKLIHVIIICLISAVFYSCSMPVKTTSGNLSAKELEDMSKADNLTPEQKVILKHAAVNLQQAEKESKEIEKLQKQIVSESKLAGAGRMAYVIIGAAVFAVLAMFVFKFLK